MTSVLSLLSPASFVSYYFFTVFYFSRLSLTFSPFLSRNYWLSHVSLFVSPFFVFNPHFSFVLSSFFHLFSVKVFSSSCSCKNFLLVFFFIPCLLTYFGSFLLSRRCRTERSSSSRRSGSANSTTSPLDTEGAPCDRSDTAHSSRSGLGARNIPSSRNSRISHRHQGSDWW